MQATSACNATESASSDASAVLDDTRLAECRLLQLEEFQVLESIFPECISSQINDGTLKLEVPVEFEHPRSLIFNADSLNTMASHPPEEQVSLAVLPPLSIHLILSPSYPLLKPPQLLSIRAAHSWLSDISNLQGYLTNMWRPGEGVLYDWIEFIRTGELLRNFESDEIIRLTHPAPRLLIPLLITYDTTSKSSQFSKNSHPCSICLTSLKGSKCLRLHCDHIFCRSCLEDFWKLSIEEGDIRRVGCPDPECVKACREADEEEVARVVSAAELQRWKWLREKKRLERGKYPSIIYCPISVCQMPVHRPENAETEFGWDRLRVCPSCEFSFCALCRRTWHGPISACPIVFREKLISDYLAAEEDSRERHVLELRFGKANILKLVAKHEEEQANEQWISSSTTECPGCHCHVEKNLGCNHITCWKCGQHFCYRCGVRLVATNPYEHFSTPHQRCFNKLFDYSPEGSEDGL